MTALLFRPSLTDRIEPGLAGGFLCESSAQATADPAADKQSVSVLLHVADTHFGAEDAPHLPSLLPLNRAAPETLGPANPIWVVQAGTATSKHLRGHKPQAINLLRRAWAQRAGELNAGPLFQRRGSSC